MQYVWIGFARQPYGPLLVSKRQLCNCLIQLLPVLYQKQLASTRNLNLSELLETVRRLELIYDFGELLRSKPSRDPYRHEVLGTKFNVNEVIHSSEESKGKREDKCDHQALREGAEPQDGPLRLQEWRGRLRRGYFRGRRSSVD